MESTLILQNPHWKNIPYQGLLDREVIGEMIQLFKLKEILIIQGIRRSGKSSVMYLMINKLLKDFPGDEILYINLEDPSFREAWEDPLHLRRLVEMASKITGKIPQILLLDEIQLVKGWESYIKSVYDSLVFRKIIVTGSNQALLNSNYATSISGRYVSLQIFPFSLNERINHLGFGNRFDILSNKHHISRLLEEMMQFGGFPEICHTENAGLKRRQLIGYFDSILMRDCLSIHAVRDVHLFKSLTTYYLSTIGRPYTYSSLARTVGSNEHTVRDYLSFLTDAWLIKEIYPWSPAIKSLVSGPKKGYCSDNGLININSLSISPDFGWLFENLVFTELVQSGLTDIRFYSGYRECDFIVKAGQTLTAIQVCYNLNKNNQERETSGLIEAMEKTGADKGIIVSPFSSMEISDKVSVIPIFDIYKEMQTVDIG